MYAFVKDYASRNTHEIINGRTIYNAVQCAVVLVVYKCEEDEGIPQLREQHLRTILETFDQFDHVSELWVICCKPSANPARVPMLLCDSLKHHQYLRLVHGGNGDELAKRYGDRDDDFGQTP